MEWLKISSEEELKELGKFLDVKKMIEDDIKEITFKNDIKNYININSSSWHELYNKIEFLRRLVCSINREVKDLKCSCTECLERENSKKRMEYFKSEAHEYIYYLLKLTESEKKKKLKIKKCYYRNKDMAMKWYREIVKKIHSSYVSINELDMAMVELAKIYNEMVNEA
ncbi:hypothetical protein QJR28_06965 [Clostridium baratii]|uniref:hypothetical protein n=1 Tax=Clostridium baratii TaxID=1561 RepID=UPI0030D159D1